LLETRIGELDGNFVKADKPFDVKIVVDGKLITGQNPASAKPLAEEIAKVLKA
jgi:putative intracellular protease/amidase